MKVLLTGCFGNIGSHTIPALLDQGHTVRCFDLPRVPHRRLLKGISQNHGDSVSARLELTPGDVREIADVERAVEGVDAVIHLAAVIPPVCNEEPQQSRRVNVEGTRNIISACKRQSQPPRLLFASSFDVFGNTQSQNPPRTTADPVRVSDPYTEHKIVCESLVRESNLTWCIFRFSDVPVLGLRAPHPIMFEIGLHNRIEALHADDAGFALAQALTVEEAWGRTLLVGGGPSCQLTYRSYLERLLDAMGVGMLSEQAFCPRDYVTDWIDSRDAQRLFHYQRHTFDTIAADIASFLGWRRLFVPLVRPFVRSRIERMSPYIRGRGAGYGCVDGGTG
ncbi:MAG TPA: NAD(P)-dependent oxidoreductase [Spirochaetia bacterium]|nr:NAD(P)-dependent oxidoreductase [Spirochaetia bacterium]